MSTILKLTLGTGETQEVPYDAESIVTIRTRIQRDPGQAPVDEDRSFSNVTGFEIVDADTGDQATIVDTADPTVATPADAITFASSLAVADAGAHIEKALTRFPGDADLLAVQAELSAIVRGDTQNTWPPAPAADPAAEVAPTADPTPPPADPAPDPAPADPAPADPAPADPAPAAATLDTPAAAIDHAQTLEIADAAAHIEAALVKFPGDSDLVEAQTELQTLIDAANQPGT